MKPMKPNQTIVNLSALLLALTLALALTACGGGSTGDSSSGSSSNGSSSDSSGGGGGDSSAVEKPTITTQPAHQSAVAGQSATFLVNATGGGTLAYQWKKGGTDISGANSSTYTIAATSIADNGAVFTVVVSNSTGTATSNSATLTVTSGGGGGVSGGGDVSTAPVEKPAITTQPADQSAVAGQSATFSVSATGGGTLGYQWQKGGTDISGANSSTYTIAATSIADNGAVFTVVVSNSTGTAATSNSATLAVTAATEKPSIGTHPANQSVTLGQTATFSVIASGSPTHAYQWTKNGTNISGATHSTYTTPVTSIDDNQAVFAVVLSNSQGFITSNTAMLTVNRYSQVANASGGNYAVTACVQDNKTGLVWEGKNSSDSLRTGENDIYTNYDDNFPDDTVLTISTNSMGYVSSVNQNMLCGFTGWRMPDHVELLGIVDASQAADPKIDPLWFPHTRANVYYWTSSYPPGDPSFTRSVSFFDGRLWGAQRGDKLAIRLVRCGAATCARN